MKVNDVEAVFNVEKGYVIRLFTEGHDGNLFAWQEEVEELFPKIIERHSDDPSACHLRGEAKWVWLRFYRSRKPIKQFEWRCRWQLKPFETAIRGSRYAKVTMIRVHRNNTTGAKT